MDDKTIEFYDRNASEIAKRYEQIESSVVATASRLRSHGSVLDVGCGSGRDLSHLASLGFDVYGVDASKHLIDEAIERHPELKDRVFFGALPHRLPSFAQTFDLVICSAVLMHVEPESLAPAIEALAAKVNKGGYLLLSVSSSREGLDSTQRDANGRVFFDHSEETLLQLIHSQGLGPVGYNTSPDAMGRDEIIWTTHVSVKGSVMARSVNEVLESMEKYRDVRARFYKPAILWSAISIIEREGRESWTIGNNCLIDEFESLVKPFSPSRSEMGWMPLWHMKNDGAWDFLLKNGGQVLTRDFKAGKPKTKKQFEDKVGSMVMNKELSEALDSEAGRIYLRSRLISMLRADREDESSLFADYLEGLSEHIFFDEPEWESENLCSEQVIESHRRMVVHKRVERSSSLPAKVKAVQGYECRCCGFDFEKTYGELGSEYIEAHHVSPVSNHFEEDRALDLTKDFVVLCANCHRMIHRMGPPWGLEQIEKLKQLIERKV